MPQGCRVSDFAEIKYEGILKVFKYPGGFLHANQCCPHAMEGPQTWGSLNVHINGLYACRTLDFGITGGGGGQPCCGKNKWAAVEGSSTVIINGRGAVRIGDMTLHCCGLGKMKYGSPNVIIGGEKKKIF